MAPRLPVYGGDVKRQPADGRRSACADAHKAYAHEDAQAALLGRDGEAIARRLGLAGRTVRQWRERYDSDHRGPGLTLALEIDAALDLGRERDQALAPLHALAAQFGCRLVAEVERQEAAAPSTEDVAEAFRAVNEVVDVLLRRCLDGQITVEDVDAFEVEFRQAEEQLHRIRWQVRAAGIPSPTPMRGRAVAKSAQAEAL